MRKVYEVAEKLSAHDPSGVGFEKVGDRTFESIAKTRSGFWVCVNISSNDLCNMQGDAREVFIEQLTSFIKKHDNRANEAYSVEWDDVCECGDRRRTHTHFRGEAVDREGRSIWIKPSILCEK